MRRFRETEKVGEKWQKKKEQNKASTQTTSMSSEMDENSTEELQFQGTVNDGPDYSALINSTLEKLKGKVKVVAVRFDKKFASTRYNRFDKKDTSPGYEATVHFEPTLRNITSGGLRDTNDPTQIIYVNEEYDHFHNSSYTQGTQLKIPNGSFEEYLDLIRQLYQIFPSTPFRYTFNLMWVGSEEMRILVNQCIVGDYAKITFCGKFHLNDALSKEEADFLLKLVKPEKYFELNCDVPDDYKHEKAFQFKSFFYHHARWITLDDLKSLRNHNVVRLGRTKFDNKDFNEFLKYWAECDEPMMNIFSAHIVEAPGVYRRSQEEMDRDSSLAEILEDVHYLMQNQRENKCDSKIILDNLKYFSPIPERRRKDIPVVHYIKSNTPRKCAELKIHQTMIEINFRMSTFLHRDIQQLLAITDELEALLKEQSVVSEEIEGYELIYGDYFNGSQEQIFLHRELWTLGYRKIEIQEKVKELREKMKGLGFSHGG